MLRHVTSVRLWCIATILAVSVFTSALAVKAQCLGSDIACCLGANYLESDPDAPLPTACAVTCCQTGNCVTDDSFPTTPTNRCTQSGDNSCNSTGTYSIDEMQIVIDGTNTGLPAITAQLRVLEPNGEYPLRGTVLFTKGDNGDGFFSDELSSGASDSYCVGKMMRELAETGFRVIDVRWNASTVGGWKSGSFGHRVDAARYATLVKFLHRKYFECASVLPGAFIAVGSSSGTAEIAYSLTSYDMSRYIDLAILASGPPEARLDLECGIGQHDDCNDSTTPRNYRWCDSLFCSDGSPSSEPDYYLGSTSWLNSCTSSTTWCGTTPALPVRPPCLFDTLGNLNEPTTRSCALDATNSNCFDYLNQNSVLYGTGDLSSPVAPANFLRTTVHTILALSDNTQAPVGGLSFYDYVQTRKRLWYISGGHTFIVNDHIGRKLLKFAIEYFTRPFVGDVDYDGDVDAADYQAVCVHIPGCCTLPSICPNTLPEFICSTANPNSSNSQPDVNNDGAIDSADLAIIQAIRPGPGTGTRTLGTCDSDARQLEDYPPPGGSACQSEFPDACESSDSCWCGS